MALTKKEKGIIVGVVATAIIAGVALTRAEAAPPAEWCCPYCTECFPSYEKLVKHVKKEHKGQRIPLPIDWD